MNIEQAIFTSAQRKNAQGYQIIGLSPGVSSAWSQQLMVWGPSQGAMIEKDPAAQSFNCHPIDENHFAISRTVYGGPEYSRRGELQLFTRYLIFENESIQAYNCDPWSLVKTCWVLGLLRFMPNTDQVLPTVEVPDSSLLGTTSYRSDHEAISELVQILQMGHPVAMLGKTKSDAHMAEITKRLSPEVRRGLSFTTGLRPSSMRPFKLHFLPCNSSTTQLNQLGITQVKFNRTSF